MIKKINSISQLRDEKKQLRLRRQYLELKIRNDWKELREELRPVNIAMDTLAGIFKKKIAANEHTTGLLKNGLAFGGNWLAKKLVDIAAAKLKKVFHKDERKKD